MLLQLLKYINNNIFNKLTSDFIEVNAKVPKNKILVNHITRRKYEKHKSDIFNVYNFFRRNFC